MKRCFVKLNRQEMVHFCFSLYQYDMIILEESQSLIRSRRFKIHIISITYNVCGDIYFRFPNEDVSDLIEGLAFSGSYTARSELVVTADFDTLELIELESFL